MHGYRLHHQSGEQGIGAETWQFIQDVSYWCGYCAPLTTSDTDKLPAPAPKWSSLIKSRKSNLGGYREVRYILISSIPLMKRPPPHLERPIRGRFTERADRQFSPP